eukprot:1364556-Pyramimonas_sp.AAC.1
MPDKSRGGMPSSWPSAIHPFDRRSPRALRGRSGRASNVRGQAFPQGDHAGHASSKPESVLARERTVRVRTDRNRL